MQILTEKVLKLAPPGGLFDQTVVRNLFPVHTENARKVFVNRAVKSGEIIRLKPGLFCMAELYRKSTLHPFVLAASLHFPSHISLESALDYHGLIPEAVYTVTSVTSQRSRAFKNPLGNFSYQRVPTNLPRAGVEATKIDFQTWAFIASPLRAIADLLYLRREVNWKRDGLGFLLDSMRMDLDDLRNVSFKHFHAVNKSIRNKRTRSYIEGLREELAP